MEKFGIFNILSALNTLTSGGVSNQKEKTQPNSDKLNEEKQKNTTTPDVFSPPEYPPAYKPMLNILARHDEISKRIDKNATKK